MLHVPPWNRFPLSIQMLDASFQRYCDESKPLPRHVTQKVGPVTDLYIYQTAQMLEALDEAEESNQWFDCEELDQVPAAAPPPVDEDQVWNLVDYDPNPSQMPSSSAAAALDNCFVCDAEFEQARFSSQYASNLMLTRVCR
jgi:hypothetical protein